MKNVLGSLLFVVALVIFGSGFAAAAKPDHAGGGKPGGGAGGENPPAVIVKSVCIDPGHGGSDPGTSVIGGSIPEKKLNLDVALELRDMLVSDYAYVADAVHLTRDADEYLTNNDRYTFCNQTASTALVSIHHNGSTDASIDYPLALYQQQNSLALAKTVGQSVADEFAQDYNPANASLRINKFPSGVLIKSTMPSMMSEGYFMTSSVRTAQLSSSYDAMVSREAAALARGLEAYFAGR